MSFGLDKSLGPKGANMIGDNGKITPEARNKFVQDVLAIMALGNKDGMGLLATRFLPIPVFPDAGPDVVLSPLKPSGEKLFWFDPEPASLLLAPVLLNPDFEFQKLIIDGIYEPLVKMLNFDGKTPLFPIFDPTSVVDLGKFPDLTLPKIPEILLKLTVQFTAAASPPTLPEAKLAMAVDFGISDAHIGDLIGFIVPPFVPTPPIPPIPAIPTPTIPQPAVVGIATPNFQDLALGFFKIPAAVFPEIITSITSPDIDPPGLFAKIIKLIVNILIALLRSLGMLVGLPKLLLSVLMVLVKNLAVMLLCDIVSQVLGTAGIVKIIATIGGVV